MVWVHLNQKSSSPGGNKIFSIQRESYTYMLFFASSLLVSLQFCKGYSLSSPPKARRCGLPNLQRRPQRLEGCAAGFQVSVPSPTRKPPHPKTKTKLKPEIARLLSIHNRHRRTSLQSRIPERLTLVARPL